MSGGVELSSAASGDADRWRGVVADIERAATPKGRAGVGCCVVEGLRLHERALRAGHTVARSLVARSLLAAGGARVEAVLDGIVAGGGEWLPVADEFVDGLTGERTAGLVGLVRVPAAPDAAELLAGAPNGRVLAAIEVEDPGNVGALVRTALAGGATAFAAVGISDPFHPKAVRTSMGAVLKLPVLRFLDAAACVGALGALGVRAVGAVSRDGVPLPRFAPPAGRLAVLVGSEAFGLAPAVVEALDARVSIPQSAEADSFSVNAAAAILLYSLRVAPGDPKP